MTAVGTEWDRVVHRSGQGGSPTPLLAGGQPFSSARRSRVRASRWRSSVGRHVQHQLVGVPRAGTRDTDRRLSAGQEPRACLDAVATNSRASRFWSGRGGSPFCRRGAVSQSRHQQAADRSLVAVRVPRRGGHRPPPAPRRARSGSLGTDGPHGRPPRGLGRGGRRRVTHWSAGPTPARTVNYE